LNALAVNTNEGNIYLEGGYADTGLTSNSGNVLIDSASSLTDATNYVQTAGITEVDGTLMAPLVEIGGGILAGGGTINGPVNIESGAAIQAGTGLVTTNIDPPATLTLGPLDLSGGSTVNEELAGTPLADIGLLNVQGNVSLPAVQDVGVDVMLLNGFDPTTAETFVFLQYTGTLNNQSFFVTDPTVDPNGRFSIGYGTNDAFLTFTPNMSGVPEPAAFLPLAGLLGCLAYGIRRKRQGKRTA
jgi:hypothetical protein